MASATNEKTKHSLSNDDFVDLTDAILTERVLFENIPDQYVKKADIPVFFIIVDDAIVNPDKDKIGLKQIGFTKAKDCLVLAPVELNAGSSYGTSRHGTATFLASTLPSQDDEFYQFCYVLESGKILGSSLPFQLNFSDESGLAEENPTHLLAIPNDDPNGLVHVTTKDLFTIEKLRQDNRQLTELKRRLEIENEEFRGRLSLERVGNDEQVTQLKEKIQELISEKSRTAAELEALAETSSRLNEEIGQCQRLVEKYKNESTENAERCVTIEATRAELNRELEQIRAQYAAMSQLAQEQATQIVELRDILSQAEDKNKISTERQQFLEQQLRDFHLTNDKTKKSIEGKIESQVRELAESRAHNQQLEKRNEALQKDFDIVKAEKDNLVELSERKQDRIEQLTNEMKTNQESFQAELNAANEKIHQLEEKFKEEAIESRRNLVGEQESTQVLKISINQLKDRCLKHQKSEMEVKKQLLGYQNLADSLRREIEELTARLAESADKYKELHSKYIEVQTDKKPRATEKKEEPAVRPTPVYVERPLDAHDALLEGPQAEVKPARRTNDDAVDNNSCPVCAAIFDSKWDIRQKTEHIESHFTAN